MRRKDSQIDAIRTGERIEYYMKKCGMSVNDLALELGVTPNAVRNYIKGVNLPDTKNLYRLRMILGEDIKDLIVEESEGGDECRKGAQHEQI